MATRGRNPGKFKTKRGGGRNFSRNLSLDEDGIAVDKTRPTKDDSDISEEDDDEEDSEEESSDDAAPGVTFASGAGGGASSGPAKPQLTRQEKKDLKKKQQAEKAEQEEEDPDLINPNHAAFKTLSISELGKTREPSRREREQQEKKEAQDRYWKLHTEGKTDQAKADLARLAKIRQERADAQAKRKAEAEAKAAEIEAKKAQTGRRT